MLNSPGLYLVNSPSGRQYIGITATSFRQRYVEHLRHPRVSTLIGKAFRKYGEKMVMTPLIVCEDQMALDIMEQRAIVVFDTLAPKGYNLSPGGNSPLRISMECEYCGKEFQGRSTVSRWCSNSCKSAGRRTSGVDIVTKECVKCGNSFETNKYYGVDHCSRSCAYVGSNRGGGYPLTIAGVNYRSLREAGRALGVSHKTIKKRHMTRRSF